jgi:hypothetical protein
MIARLDWLLIGLALLAITSGACCLAVFELPVTAVLSLGGGVGAYKIGFAK